MKTGTGPLLPSFGVASDTGGRGRDTEDRLEFRTFLSKACRIAGDRESSHEPAPQWHMKAPFGEGIRFELGRKAIVVLQVIGTALMPYTFVSPGSVSLAQCMGNQFRLRKLDLPKRPKR